MTVSAVGKQKVTELIEVEMTDGELGTSNQAASINDTDLIAAVTSTIETLSVSRDGQQLVMTYNLNSVTGNGNTYTEYGNFFTTSETLLNRITFTGVPKNSAIEFQVSTIINVN